MRNYKLLGNVKANLLRSCNEDLLFIFQIKPPAFGNYYDEKNIYCTVNLLYNAAMLVSKGMGCAVTIDGAVQLYNHPELNFRPLYPKIEQTSVLIWKKNQIISTCAVKFIEFIKCKSVMVSNKK